jgi:ANTAR domain/GAF domain
VPDRPVIAVDERVVWVARLVADEPVRAGDRGGVVGTLRRLCSAAERVLSASGVGVNVVANEGMRGVAAVSEPAYQAIEELQFTLGEGPCRDAFASHRPVLVPDLSGEAMVRWPGYARALHASGMRAVFAFPLQVGAASLGALDVFRVEPGALTAAEFRDALTFADAAVTTLLDGQERAAQGAMADGLDEVTERRAEVFQAQGMVAVQLRVSLADALARLRAHSYAENRPLGDVARDVVARKLSLGSGPS